MKKENEHTPLPWYQRPQSTGQAQIYGADGKTIAITYYNDEDAELIVRAVNVHDALVAALRRLDDEVDSGLTVSDGLMAEVRRVLSKVQGE